jgi:hypothetical protein
MSKFTDTLAAHAMVGIPQLLAIDEPPIYFTRCRCEAEFEAPLIEEVYVLHAAHVEAMLTEAGCAVVELPKWTKSEWSLQGIWHTECGDDVWAKSDGTVGHDNGGMSDNPATWYQPSEAENLALALLAAARSVPATTKGIPT